MSLIDINGINLLAIKLLFKIQDYIVQDGDIVNIKFNV